MNVLFEWKDSLLTGLDSVDQQHHRLVDLINGLAASLVDGHTPDHEHLTVAHAALLDYTQTHFADEERLMAEFDLDPRHITYHRSQHDFFVQQLTSLPLQGDDASTQTTLSFLVGWLSHHILGLDQSLARQVMAIRGGADASSSFLAEASRRKQDSDPLLEAINVMFKVVSERNQELLRTNQLLEQRVAERTAELTRANQHLQLLAVNDELTGLPNRRFAISMLAELWQGLQRNNGFVAVLMLDADKFKQVNDHHGHATGDALLRKLALQLRQAVRGSDIVCRLGGDEFLVVCPRCDRAGAIQVAEKILESATPHRTENGNIFWDGCMSIGVAMLSAEMAQPEDLLLAADKALYRAKRNGGHRIECA